MRKTDGRVFFTLLIIIIISAILRFYKLDKIPNSLSADETAFAYNAYSILKTGRDEFGYRFPLYFRSFDDYKNPVFGYVLIPFIHLFGLNGLSIRIPSALAGIGVVFLSFALTRNLTHRLKSSLLVALFTSISPWLIQYSRVALDMELALFFSLTAVWLFLKASKHSWLYFFSTFTFGLSFYSYHSSKVWVPVILILLILFKKRFNWVALGSIIFFAIFTLPYFYLIKTSHIGLRPYAISVFSNQEEVYRDAKLIVADEELVLRDGKLVHNRRLTRFNQAINGYLGIFNPQILFAQSRYNHSVNTSLMYIWQLPLIFIGVWAMYPNPYLLFFLLTWIFISFIPGGLTLFPPYDRRILLGSFPLIFFSAIGFRYLLAKLKSQPPFFAAVYKIFLIMVVCFFLYIYVHHYYVHGQSAVVNLWGNGMKEVVTVAESEKSNYQEVLVSLGLNQILTFFLYYTQYSPIQYLKGGGTTFGGYLENGNKFDTFKFQFIKPEDWTSGKLYIWSVAEHQPCLKAYRTALMTDGQPLAYIGIYAPDELTCQEWQIQN